METEVQLLGAERLISSSHRREHALAARATRNHGVVARRELLEIGFSSDQIERMRRSRRLHAVHRGVYAVGHGTLTRRGRWMAAVLACGPGALLSHRSCAALTGIRAWSATYIEVIVPQRRGRIDGVRAYICPGLHEHDRHEIDGIPCTSLARTLLDLAAVLPRRGLEHACDEAEVQQLFDLKAIDELLARSHGARGSAKLRAVLAEHRIGTTRTRPGLEELTLTTLDRCGVRRAEVNARVFCRPGVTPEVDFLWRRERLILETDGNQFHHTPRQIARDRRKEADLVRAGYRVLRATWDQLEQDPRSVALMVNAALEGGYDNNSA
jgi:hypothetical protein